LIYVACSLAVHGGGTLCLLAGMEQVEFVSKVRAKHEQFPALAPAYVAKCHSFSIGKPLAYLLKGRMAEKDVDKLDANKLQTERKQIRPCVRGNTGINRRCRKQKSRATNPALRHAHGMAGVLKPLGEHSRTLCRRGPSRYAHNAAWCECLSAHTLPAPGRV
jgi:hypothetical protein